MMQEKQIQAPLGGRRPLFAACSLMACSPFVTFLASAAAVILTVNLRTAYVAAQVLSAAMLAGLCFLARNKFGCGLGRGTDAYGLLLGVGCTVCFYPMALLVSEIAGKLAPDPVLQDAMSSAAVQFSPMMSWIVIALLPAVTEELLYRGVVFGAFRQYGFAAALAASAISFAAAHGSLHQAAYTLFMGLVWACAREISGSVLPGVIAHMAFNTMALTAMFQPVKHRIIQMPFNTDILHTYGALVVLAFAMLMAGIWMLGRARIRFRSLGIQESGDGRPGKAAVICFCAACAVNIGATVLLNLISA